MSYKPHSMEGQKTVRIDDRTVICVSANIPDDQAKADYIKKRETITMVTNSPRWKNPKKKVEDETPEDIMEAGISEAILEDDEELEYESEESEPDVIPE